VIHIGVGKTKLELVLLNFFVPAGFPPYFASSATIEHNSNCVLTTALLLGFLEEQMRHNRYTVRGSQTAYRRVFPLQKQLFIQG
jgi:hypothetical protein